MPSLTSTVSIPTDRGPMPAYVAEPSGTDVAPGVLLVHDLIGMGSDLRRQAEWLADEGFVTVAPDLFHWAGRARCFLASARDYLRRSGRMFDDIEATRVWLSDQPRCSGQVAVLGFCFGGGFAVLLATHGTYAASSVNYGLVPRDTDELLSSACPMIGSYGADDPSMAPSARRLAALAEADPRHEVTVYPGAGHAFLNDYDPAELPAVFRLAANIPGVATVYEPDAAHEARQRIVAFLHRNLAAGSEGP